MNPKLKRNAVKPVAQTKIHKVQVDTELTHMPAADKSTLAARRVPRSHLPDALHRPARALQPMDSLQLPAEGETKVLIRLFTDLRGRP